MTNKEINEAVARKLGWIYIDKEGSWFKARSFDIEKQLQPGGLYRDYMVNVKDEQEVFVLPNFCTDISAAWEIVEYLAKRNWFFTIGFNPSGYWWVKMGDGVDSFAFEQGDKNTAPMAICKAFLELKQ